MISTEFKGKLALRSCNLGEKGDTFDSYTFFLQNKSFYTLHDFMHQSIPPALSPPSPPRFDTHAVSYQNITTRKVLLEEKQIGSFVMDRNKF